MPELPEVETVRRDLERLAQGAGVLRLDFHRPHLLEGSSAAAAKRALEGARLTELARHGKVLILRFSSGWSLLVHFGMTGRLCVAQPHGCAQPKGEKLPPHTRTVLRLEDGRRLVHVDARRLGGMELVATDREPQARLLAGLGPDALTDPASAAELLPLLARRRSAIKLFLLDQKPQAGVGNIYACEILARARIAPDTPCRDLTPRQVAELVRQTREVLQEAVAARGTTISDYRTGTGEAGGFQTRTRVYGREGERCLRRGCRGVVARLVQGQRSTYFCPSCQR